MRDWIAANLVFVGMQVFAAAIFLGSILTMRAFGVSDSTERTLAGYFAVAAVILTGITARRVLRLFMRN